MTELAARREAFRRLHESGCFVLPNPWDVGSAHVLSQLGFKALATTSSGFALSRGLPDGPRGVSREQALAHFRELAEASGLPLNADFQNGYADDPGGVAESVRLCVETGVAGLSIEDATGDPGRPLYELSLAVERIRAAREAIDGSGHDVLLTARAECHLVGWPQPLAESVRRLRAYAAAGADVLYAPGPRDADAIREIVAAVAPRPVNVLVAAATGLSVSELSGLGVRRISLGSALARAAWTGFLHAARTLSEDGSFAGLDGIVTLAELDARFRSR